MYLKGGCMKEPRREVRLDEIHPLDIEWIVAAMAALKTAPNIKIGTINSDNIIMGLMLYLSRLPRLREVLDEVRYKFDIKLDCHKEDEARYKHVCKLLGG
jgi:hypothetical protein